MTQISRRRFIQITAASAAFASMPLTALSNQQKSIISWDGISLGADSSMQIFHSDKAKAKKILQHSLKEISRLENFFSLYKKDSAINQLNKNGAIKNPPEEFTQLLTHARNFSDITKGAFDITVQSLHEKGDGVVDYKKIEINKSEIRFSEPNMRITLNGIAQGYITDKITELMKNEGVENALIELGEKYAIGNHPSARKWKFGIANSDKIVELSNMAIATSSNQNILQDSENHIFDPSQGKPAQAKISASVISPTATNADALSTALCVNPNLNLAKSKLYSEIIFS